MNKIALVFFILILSQNILSQVTIGLGEAPERVALLQLKDQSSDSSYVTATKGGLLLPRVRLLNINTLEPFMSPSDTEYDKEKKLSMGLVVYNINESLDDNLHTGVYYWSGEKWELSTTNPQIVNNNNENSLKVNINQSSFVTLSGSQSYGLLMRNQGVSINPEIVIAPTIKDSYSDLISTERQNNGNDEALLLEYLEEGRVNFFRINLQYIMGNNPPAETRYFEVSIVSKYSGAVVYHNSVVVPGKLDTGHIGHFFLFFPTIADKGSIKEGYRIIFSTDTAASLGLPNNISVKIVDITRVYQ